MDDSCPLLWEEEAEGSKEEEEEEEKGCRRDDGIFLDFRAERFRRRDGMGDGGREEASVYKGILNKKEQSASEDTGVI